MAKKVSKSAVEDPVDTRTGHFRVVLPGQASEVLDQPIFDVSKVDPRPVEAIWHCARTK